MLDRRNLLDHQARNRRHTALVLGGLAGLTGLAGWLLAGQTGVVAAFAVLLAMLAMNPQNSAAMLRAVYGARPWPVTSTAPLWRIHAELCRRAGLETMPPLLRIPSPAVMALSTGWGRHAAIALSDGAVALFPPGELAAVMAHEIAHIRAGDLKLLRLADTAGHLTHAVAAGTLLTLAFFLPEFTAEGMGPNLLALGVLALAPIGCDLLRMGLSRTREFAADSEAAALCGSADDLISALARLDFNFAAPSPKGWLRLIRTHPTTAERIARLQDLAPPPPFSLPFRTAAFWRPGRHR